jgi:hypothetical protein
MARYNTFKYGDATVKYGDTSASLYEATPFVAAAIDYDKIRVSWIMPGTISGYTYSRLRIVRNQDYPSETQEDGIIIVDLSSPFSASGYQERTDGTLKDADGNLFPALKPGKFVYYSIWLLKVTGGNTFWDKIADTSTVLAKSHDTLLSNTDDSVSPAGLSAAEIEFLRTNLINNATTRTQTTHQKFLELLPRVYTTANESPLDIVDETSDLSRFLKGFTYTIDEIFTFADLLLPTRDATNYSADLLRAKSFELGITADNQRSQKIQQKLVREAQYITSRKGTALALETLAESMTGFNAVVIPSPNLMLSAQDSSFYKGIGNWKVVGGCTLTVEKVNTPPAKATFTPDLDKAINLVYSGKVVTSAANAQIVNGSSSPITQGIPVTAGSSYTFSAYVQNTGAGTITPTIRWYDVSGTYISASTTTAWTTSSSWAKKTLTATAPAGSVYASTELKFNSSGQTYYLDMMQFAVGSAAAYEEARTANVHLSPTKINYIVNPSFEVDKSNWTITDSGSSIVTDSSPDVVSGTKSLSATISSTQKIEAVVTSGTGELAIPSVVVGAPPLLVPTPKYGDYYTYSFYAKKATSGTLNATITFAASSGSLSKNVTKPIAITNSWNRYYVNLFVESAYVAPTLTLTLLGVDSGVVRFDAAQLERAYSPTDYFDGSMSINGGEWSGTANASATYVFPNKSTVVSRLATDMPSYLVTGTPYRVITDSGIVSGNMGEVKGFAP